MESEIIALLSKYIEDEIDLESSFYSLGINSLKVLMIKIEIENHYNIEIPYEDFGKVETINDLIKFVMRIKEC